MYKNIFLAVIMFSSFTALSQNVGIGTTTPTHGKLVVHGVAGAGRTSGFFGTDRGISLLKNIPAIGFNMYHDDSTGATNGRYAGVGFAARFSYKHNQPNLSEGIEYRIYPSGTTDGALPAGLIAFSTSNNGRLDIMTDGNAVIDVGRSTGGDGTAMFQGTNYNSHINYSTEEDTYIRPGKSGDVIINDIAGGKVIIGDGAARVGINTGSPVYPLEVRQVAGTGLRMANAPYPAEHWEWRVAGSPANFLLYHQGVQKNYLDPTNGAMHPASDVRLKTNIQGLPPVMEKILKLKPVTYEMIKDNPHHFRSTGFIAQEVSALFPQLTFKNDNDPDDMMSLQYSGFNVIAIKGIQEEETHIADLEIKTKEAEQRLLEIEKKIAAMKTKTSSN